MRLAPFILDNIEPIMTEWEAFAKSLPPGHEMISKALRNDADYASVFAWEFQGNGSITPPKLHREPLTFETVELTQRSYK